MFDHTGIVVTDLPKARRFYEAVAQALGLSIDTPSKDFFILGKGSGQIPYLWIRTLRPSYWIGGSRAGLPVKPVRSERHVHQWIRRARA